MDTTSTASPAAPATQAPNYEAPLVTSVTLVGDPLIGSTICSDLTTE
jgi:hypothetical protein